MKCLLDKIINLVFSQYVFHTSISIICFSHIPSITYDSLENCSNDFFNRGICNLSPASLQRNDISF